MAPITLGEVENHKWPGTDHAGTQTQKPGGENLPHSSELPSPGNRSLERVSRGLSDRETIPDNGTACTDGGETSRTGYMTLRGRMDGRIIQKTRCTTLLSRVNCCHISRN